MRAASACVGDSNSKDLPRSVSENRGGTASASSAGVGGGGKKPPAGGKKRPRGRPFPPGRSGNPRGRPKKLADIEELAFKMSPDILTHLKRVALAGVDAPAVSAARIVLSYGLGNPRQRVEVSGPAGDPIEVADASRRVDAKLLAMLAAIPKPPVPAAAPTDPAPAPEDTEAGDDDQPSE